MDHDDMTLIGRFLDKLRSKPPRISTPYGDVTECARKQAALNMRDDPALRERVVEVLARELCCPPDIALKEARRRYPEGFRRGR
jgi:hypothetical protein